MDKRDKLFWIGAAIWILAISILIAGIFVRNARAQANSDQAVIRRIGEQSLDDGVLLGSVAQLDGGNVVISLSQGDAAWYLIVTRLGDGLMSDRVTLPWGRPGTVAIAAAGNRLHVTAGWVDGHISAYSWEFGAPFSREWSQYIPVASD